MTCSVQLDDSEHSVLSNAIIKEYNEAMLQRGKFLLGVAGGSLVALLSKILPTLPIDSSTLHLLLVDERNVPVSHPDNTYNQYKCTLPADYFAQITFPTVCDGSITVEEAARIYGEYLVENNLLMDLCILGIGPDGHIASLFPNHPAFLTSETTCPTLAVHDAPKKPSERVTMSLAYIRSARRILMFVKGREKAEVVRRVVLGEDGGLPAACVEAEWILDNEASSLL